MKIIHCADIHLGAPMDSHFGVDEAERRRGEIRATFNRMLAYAARENVKVIILAGDVFDADRPFRRDKQFFYDAVRANPNIDFLYLRGNHDGLESYSEDGLVNLKTFGDRWTAYSYGNVDIYGAELPYGGDMYAELKCISERYNIAVLHGQTGGDINLGRLRDRNIDYLALGHIHSYSAGKLDSRGSYAYSGCLEGRGFDETGEKGFVLLDTDKNSFKFVPFAGKVIRLFRIDVTGADSAYEAFARVKDKAQFAKNDVIRVELCGRINFYDDRLAEDIAAYLSPSCAYASVKDKTVKNTDVSAVSGETSLRGEFVRTVLADASIAEEDKERVIILGLDALARGEVEL